MGRYGLDPGIGDGLAPDETSDVDHDAHVRRSAGLCIAVFPAGTPYFRTCAAAVYDLQYHCNCWIVAEF